MSEDRFQALQDVIDEHIRQRDRWQNHLNPEDWIGKNESIRKMYEFKHKLLSVQCEVLVEARDALIDKVRTNGE